MVAGDGRLIKFVFYRAGGGGRELSGVVDCCGKGESILLSRCRILRSQANVCNKIILQKRYT